MDLKALNEQESVLSAISGSSFKECVKNTSKTNAVIPSKNLLPKNINEIKITEKLRE